jgi:hypothetical protein
MQCSEEIEKTVVSRKAKINVVMEYTFSLDVNEKTNLNHFTKTYLFNFVTPGDDAIKKFIPTLGIPYLAV